MSGALCGICVLRGPKVGCRACEKIAAESRAARECQHDGCHAPWMKRMDGLKLCLPHARESFPEAFSDQSQSGGVG